MSWESTNQCFTWKWTQKSPMNSCGSCSLMWDEWREELTVNTHCSLLSMVSCDLASTSGKYCIIAGKNPKSFLITGIFFLSPDQLVIWTFFFRNLPCLFYQLCLVSSHRLPAHVECEWLPVLTCQALSCGRGQVLVHAGKALPGHSQDTEKRRSHVSSIKTFKVPCDGTCMVCDPHIKQIVAPTH